MLVVYHVGRFGLDFEDLSESASEIACPCVYVKFVALGRYHGIPLAARCMLTSDSTLACDRSVNEYDIYTV